MNKKGFSLIELLAVILIIGMISTIAVVSITTVLQKSRDNSYKVLLSSIEDATESYILDNTNTLMPTTSSSITITTKDLIDNDYLRKMIDPRNKNEECDAENSYITVTRDITNTVNVKLNYKICLRCIDYESKGCEE